MPTGFCPIGGEPFSIDLLASPWPMPTSGSYKVSINAYINLLANSLRSGS